jgi:hypothetical protein
VSTREPWRVEYVLGAYWDLDRLDNLDPAVADAATAAVSDVAHHHKRGKALGERHITGDLTGLFRVKFDLPDISPQRFRLVYQHEGDSVIIWALGPREDAQVYREVLNRQSGRPQESGQY